MTKKFGKAVYSYFHEIGLFYKDGYLLLAWFTSNLSGLFLLLYLFRHGEFLDISTKVIQSGMLLSTSIAICSTFLPALMTDGYPGEKIDFRSNKLLDVCLAIPLIFLQAMFLAECVSTPTLSANWGWQIFFLTLTMIVSAHFFALCNANCSEQLQDHLNPGKKIGDKLAEVKKDLEGNDL